MPFAGKIRELQSALLAVLFVFALGVVGIFLVAESLAGLLAPYMHEPYGKLIVGGVAVLPMIILIIVRWITAAAKNHPNRHLAHGSNFMDSPDLPEHLRELIETVQRLTRSAPMAAIALAVVAGVVVMRHPASLPLVLGILREQAR